MSNGPIVTVEQGLEINAWLKEREKSTRGLIRNLRHNLDQSIRARQFWRDRYNELRAENLMLKRQRNMIKCRRRLIPIVRFLLDI
jgi:hypothetical protein